MIFLGLPFEKREYEVLSKQGGAFSVSGLPVRGVIELLDSGIVVLNKPSGPTSHQAVDYLKRVLDLKKAGHSGTLDPGVTGVLPVALSRATRVTNCLLSAGKEYVCLMHLHKALSISRVKEIFASHFSGVIEQLPPVKSAVKRQLRKREIYYVDVLEVKDKAVLFRVGCEAGTYIRKLVHDFGVVSGVGAHMVELVRTKAGPFVFDEMVSLQDLADAFHYFREGDDSFLKGMLLPVERGVEHLKKIYVHDGAINSLCHGAFLKVPGVAFLDSDIVKHDLVAVMSLKNELVLVGRALLNSNNLMKLSKGLAVKTEQVFMRPEQY